MKKSRFPLVLPTALKLMSVFALAAVPDALSAQERLYPAVFPLENVKLLDGPFRKAQDLNVKVLLSYDTDRLLAPYLKAAGLAPKAESFENWEGLDGHVGGHYLSALAIHYASTGNKECKRRMDYMVSELQRCHDARKDGYVGGVPDGDACWSEIRKGNVGVIWKYWVPWYNVHKTFAGLRDAYIYGGNKKALKLFTDFCDWSVDLISVLNDEQMEQMLDNEFGGMDEVLADAYALTGNVKYLDAAKRFSHKWLLDSMAAHVDNLDNKHANTQVPKVVGYQRIAEVSADAGRDKDARLYEDAAAYFWQTVVNTRSLAFGGNSRREHFPTADDCKSYVEEREGPESCNTNNMLKLSEGLFRMTHDARYADYYERAMLNHILSTQHPGHGGYVYFTPARPAHYRVYSAPNSAMWCCVGTGMENHGKYGQFIYTHSSDSVYVNLFVASRLTWRDKGMTITQETAFPDSDVSRLTVSTRKPVKATLMIRYPGWIGDGEMKAVCAGRDYAANAGAGTYFPITRVWKDGDVVELSLPMGVTVEEMPNVPDYIAIMKGPVLMGARMGNEGLDGLVAGDDRWGHIAHGPLVSVFDTPLLIGSRDEIVRKLQDMRPVSGDMPLCYTVPGLFEDKYKDLRLEPFFRLHDCRYMMYWLSMTPEQYEDYRITRIKDEKYAMELDRRTVDMVTPGEQQPEVDHKMTYVRSESGNHNGESWRDARDGGHFSYNLLTQGNKSLTLWTRYWGNESGNRAFDILVDGEILAEENVGGKWNTDGFQVVEYPLPQSMVEGKESVTVTFRAKEGNIAGGLFGLRLLSE